MSTSEYGQELHGMAERNRVEVQELRAKLTTLEKLQEALDEAASEYGDEDDRSENETGSGPVMTHAELRQYEDPRDAFLEMTLRNGGRFHLRTAAAQIYESAPERRKRDSVRAILHRYVRNSDDWEDAGDGEWQVIGEAALAAHAPADATELDSSEDAEASSRESPDAASEGTEAVIGPSLSENERV